jgi:hypothetical protein
MTSCLIVSAVLYIYLAVAVSAGYGGGRNVHLPGVTPHSYEIGETVSVAFKHTCTISTSRNG